MHESLYRSRIYICFFDIDDLQRYFDDKNQKDKKSNTFFEKKKSR